MVDKSSDSLKFKDIEGKYNQLMNLNHESKIDLEPLTEMVDKYEKMIIEEVMESTDYNVTKSAKLLNVPRQTLQRKVKKYNII